jgi:shikimate dehydrogenase
MTPYAEVIGDPIAHSRSPQIHRFWLESLGLPGDYRATRVTRAELAAFIAGRRADPDWRGCNVTMPLKLDALLLADQRSDRAAAAGAANLLFTRDGNLLAANTDVGAVARLVEPLIAETKSITLLGNGGAARAVLVALQLLDFHETRIQSRDLGEARKLAVEFGTDIAPAPFDSPITSDGLINATPLGMAGRECLNCDLSHMPAGGWVFDMVYDPTDTPLVRAARERGLAVVTGLDMLIEQAAASFKLLFGQNPPRDRDAQLWQKLRQ